MAFSTSFPLQVNGSLLKPSVPDRFRASLTSTFKPFFNDIRQLPMAIDVLKTVKNTSRRMLETFVDSTFRFVDQPLLPSQSNFAPVEEIGEAVEVATIEGKIPADFPEGIYVRNGPNPLFGGRKSALSIFGTLNQVWIEGEGMLHALYFNKDSQGDWAVTYKNKFVQTDTFKLETERSKPAFLPNIDGDPLAVLAANLLNQWRYGTAAKHYHNVSLFEHAGTIYTATENHLPQEVDLSTLESGDYWDPNGAWNGPFTSHPKKAPTGELVTIGVDGKRPHAVLGVVSADGKTLLHKADLGFEKFVFIHEIGVTQNYNVIVVHPVVADMDRVVKGGSLITYEKEGSVPRIAVIPRYGDADSIKWFEVQPNSTYHLLNCFEDGNEVIVRGCSARAPILPGPEWGEDKFDWFSRGFTFTKPVDDNDSSDGSIINGDYGYLFHHLHEWRLDMVTGQVKERNASGTEFSMDFPFINGEVTGLRHKYGYTQFIDSIASSTAGMTKYGGLAKLHFDENNSATPMREEKWEQQQRVKVEYHKFPENSFCTGSVFVPKQGGADEDDGWVVTFVHNEDTNVSQAYIIDAKNFGSEPTAVITLDKRVPYGHHGLYVVAPSPA